MSLSFKNVFIIIYRSLNGVKWSILFKGRRIFSYFFPCRETHEKKGMCTMVWLSNDLEFEIHSWEENVFFYGTKNIRMTRSWNFQDIYHLFLFNV